jgi:hypothetical protein
MGALFVNASTLYAAAGGIKVGILTIKAIPGTRHNLIVRSSVDIEAVFTETEGKKEKYIGERASTLATVAGRTISD